MKHILPFALILTLAVALMAACGSQPTDTSGTGGAAGTLVCPCVPVKGNIAQFNPACPMLMDLKQVEEACAEEQNNSNDFIMCSEVGNPSQPASVVRCDTYMQYYGQGLNGVVCQVYAQNTENDAGAANQCP